MIIKRSDIVEQYLLLLLKIIYLKQERERERKRTSIYKVHEKRVEMSNKIIIFILFVFDEFDDKQIQIHSNMHFHY
jgi:hypothetical protein